MQRSESNAICGCFALLIIQSANAWRRSVHSRYREVWRQAQGSAAPPKMALVRFIVVAESDAQAMSIARRSYLRWHRASPMSEMNGTVSDSPLRTDSFDT